MADQEAPAPVAEGTDTSLPAEGVAPQTDAPAETPPEQQPGETETAHRRRLIEAARIERRAQQAKREAEERSKRAEEIERRYGEQEKRLAEMQERLQRSEAARKAALRDPKSFLADAGLDLDTIVRAYLDEGPTPDVLMRDMEQRSRSEVEEIRAELKKLREEQTQKEQAAQQAQMQQAAHALRNEIEQTLRSDPDKFELTIAQGQEGEVYELMRLAYQQNGTVLPVAKAAEMIEDFLFDQAKKMTSAKKLASLFKPQEQAAAPAQAGKPAPQAKPATDAREPKASTTTLTSKLATSPAQPAEADTMLPAEEMIQVLAKKVAAKKAEKRAASK